MVKSPHVFCVSVSMIFKTGLKVYNLMNVRLLNEITASKHLPLPVLSAFQPSEFPGPCPTAKQN